VFPTEGPVLRSRDGMVVFPPGMEVSDRGAWNEGEPGYREERPRKI